MDQRPWFVLPLAFLLAAALTLCMFAVIPLLVEQTPADSVPLLTRPIRVFHEQPPEPVIEERSRPVEEQPPELIMAAPQPAAPQPPRIIQAPELDFKTSPPTIRMSSGIRPVPMSAVTDIYHAQDLDKAPVLSYQMPPVYPYRARRMALNGEVQIQFDVATDGSVSNIVILESKPPGIFDDAVLTAVRQWRFQPGELMGGQVRTRMTRTIVFNLED